MKRTKRKLFSYSVGRRGDRVLVAQRAVDGFIYGRVFDPALRGGKGDYRWATLHHRDEQRAKEWAAEQHARLVRGEEELRVGRITLARLCTLYLEHHSPRKVASSQLEDRRRAELWCRVLGGGKDPHRISASEWDGFITARRPGAIDARGRPVADGARRPVRDRAIEGDLVWLKLVLAWGCRWRTANGRYLLREIPVRGFEMPRELNPRRPLMSTDRYRALLAVADQVTMQLRLGGGRRRVRSYLTELLTLAFHTGRRLSALLALRYDDLLLDVPPHGQIRWRRESDKTRREWVVDIHPEVRTAINRVLSERPGIGAAYLFPAAGGPSRPLSRDVADRWLRVCERLAGLRPLEGSLWHANRRAWATARKPYPLVDVAYAGGWTDTRTLLRIYQQPDPVNIRRVVTGAEELREVGT